MWSNVRFSPTITMTCLMGLAVGRLAAGLVLDGSAARAVCTIGPKKLCNIAIKAKTARAACRKLPADFLNCLVIVPLRFGCWDPNGSDGWWSCMAYGERVRALA